MQTGEFNKAIEDFTKANLKENYPPFQWFNFHERALAYKNLGLIEKASKDNAQEQELHRWVSGKEGIKDLPPS